jgi:hypothetical protein
MRLSLLFTLETDALWVIREQCLLFLSKYLSIHLRIFRGRVEHELIAPECLIPGMWQQLVCNKDEITEGTFF